MLKGSLRPPQNTPKTHRGAACSRSGTASPWCSPFHPSRPIPTPSDPGQTPSDGAQHPRGLGLRWGSPVRYRSTEVVREARMDVTHRWIGPLRGVYQPIWSDQIHKGWKLKVQLKKQHVWHRVSDRLGQQYKKVKEKTARPARTHAHTLSLYILIPLFYRTLVCVAVQVDILGYTKGLDLAMPEMRRSIAGTPAYGAAPPTQLGPTVNLKSTSTK